MNTLTVPVLFASTLGLYTFFCGLFWFTWEFVSHSVHFP